MYHAQNQVMKWSVATGVLSESTTLSFLNAVDVTRTNRFDRWYNQSEGLRFRRPLPFKPESEWFNGNETLPIIRSYSFPSAGRASSVMSGGVSLGSAKSVKEGSLITRSLEPGLRRGGLDYSSSSASGLKGLKGSRFELRGPDARGGLVTSLQPGKTARFRSGPTAFQLHEFSTSIASKAGIGEVSLLANVGEFGRLTSHRIPGGSRLNWHHGGFGKDHSLASEVLLEFRSSPSEKAASALAARDRFLPDKGVYVVSDGDGFEAVLSPATASSGGSGGQPPWRVVRVTDGQDPKPNGWFSLSGVRQSSLDDLIAVRFGGKQRVVRATDEPLQAGFSFSPRLNATPWQRLKPLPNEAANTQPGRLDRLFTSVEPPAEGKPISIESSVAGKKELEGWVTDEAVFVKRPPGATPEAFNDFVTSEGITGKALHDVIAQAESGNPPSKVRLGTAVRSDPGVAAARAAGAGDGRAVLEQMHTAAKEGRFDEAVRSFRQQVRDDNLARLAEGEVNPTARRLLNMATPADSPDALLFEAMRRLATGDLDPAVAATKKAAQGGDLTGDAAKSMDAIARARGQEPLADYLVLKGGKGDKVPPGVSKNIDLVAEGRRARTVYTPQRKPAMERLVGSDIRKAFLAADAIYVEDGGLLGKLDWDAAPGL